MTPRTGNNVISLPYGDFEIAINAITSSISDTVALKNSLRRFLASRDVISSLSENQIERLFSLIPMDFNASVPEDFKMKVKTASSPLVVWPDKGLFEDIFADEDRRDEALAAAIRELGARDVGVRQFMTHFGHAANSTVCYRLRRSRVHLGNIG